MTSMRAEYQEYFIERFARYGDDVRTFWGSRRSQEERFQVLCSIGDLTDKSVLDVGCGFGDLFGYLRDRGVKISSYRGFDCVDGVLEIARERYPEGQFENADLLSVAGETHADYVFASGVFFLASEDWGDYTFRMLHAMHSVANCGMAANFLSQYSGHTDDGTSYYADPAKVFTRCMQEISPIVDLRHSYRRNDFTVFVYKDWQNGN
ncbi:MAG TPA: class I SAM-dependent methyltransferase [Terracidiphilus sp.]|nr:class I SAM-dependent methyltransferase [Terracidiphilus sp.]